VAESLRRGAYFVLGVGAQAVEPRGRVGAACQWVVCAGKGVVAGWVVEEVSLAHWVALA